MNNIERSEPIWTDERDGTRYVALLERDFNAAGEEIAALRRQLAGAVDALVDAHGYLIHEERDAALVVMERACEMLGVDPVTHFGGR